MAAENASLSARVETMSARIETMSAQMATVLARLQGLPATQGTHIVCSYRRRKSYLCLLGVFFGTFQVPTPPGMFVRRTVRRQPATQK